MLKAHNTRLKAEVKQLKSKLSFTQLVGNVMGSNFRARLSFCYAILFKKL